MLIELKEKLYDVAPGIALNELEPGISMYHCIGGDEVRVVNNAVVPQQQPQLHQQHHSHRIHLEDLQQ